MSDRLDIVRTKGVLLAGLGALAVSVVLMLVSVSPAHAGYRQFCWGVNLLGQGNTCNSYANDGIVGLVTEVDGSSPDHSVCVLAWYGQGTEMCSPGPNQGVYNSSPPGLLNTVAQIRPNAAGWTKVYGGVVLCANPGC